MANMSEAVGLIAVCKAHPDKLDQARAVLVPTVAWAMAKPGCLEYVLNIDRARPNEFVFYEVWKDQAALDDHWASEGFKELVAKLEDVLIEKATVTLLERIA
jgi:quinol monooxygenase YgiN